MENYKNVRENVAGDAGRFGALWARAGKLVDEWMNRAEELRRKPGDVSEPISTDPGRFDKLVFASWQTGKPLDRTEVNLHPTRLLESLTDFTDTETPLDRFGGRRDEARRSRATGFFRTEKQNGRWWVIDPDGYPCYVRGVNSVTYSYHGSRAQEEAAMALYGDAAGWAEAASRQLRDDLGFNFRVAIEPGSAEIKNATHKLSYQDKILFIAAYEGSLGTRDTTTPSGSTLLTDGMHVFDEDFAPFCDRTARQALEEKQCADDPWLLGYTTDNEIPSAPQMLDQYLTLDIDTKRVNDTSFVCAWEFLHRMTGKDDATMADITPGMRDLFRGFVYDRYFAAVVPAIRKYDPNHMILGCRVLGSVRQSEWICRVTGAWCDCMTLNWYRDWTPQARVLESISLWTGLPLLITEFYAKAVENEGNIGNAAGAGFLVQTQEERGMFYQNYTLRLLECKNVVGWHWFMYLDADPYEPNRTEPDLRAANKGIYSNTHKLYKALGDRMAAINRRAYALIDYFDAKK